MFFIMVENFQSPLKIFSSDLFMLPSYGEKITQHQDSNDIVRFSGVRFSSNLLGFSLMIVHLK